MTDTRCPHCGAEQVDLATLHNLAVTMDGRKIQLVCHACQRVFFVPYPQTRSHAMPTAADREILRDAIARYGRDAQHRMAIEECGELIVAMCHIQRDRIPVSELAGEIADMQIMLEQLMLLYDCHGQVAAQWRQKIARLQRRLDGTHA